MSHKLCHTSCVTSVVSHLLRVTQVVSHLLGVTQPKTPSSSALSPQLQNKCAAEGSCGRFEAKGVGGRQLLQRQVIWMSNGAASSDFKQSDGAHDKQKFCHKTHFNSMIVVLETLWANVMWEFTRVRSDMCVCARVLMFQLNCCCAFVAVLLQCKQCNCDFHKLGILSCKFY